MAAADGHDTPQVLGQAPCRDEGTPQSLLRQRVEVRLERGRIHRRVQRRGDPLPLPRQQHPDPMDPGTGSSPHHRQLTSGKDTWSARCVETRTAGAGGGLRETTGRNADTAPVGLPHSGGRRGGREQPRQSRVGSVLPDGPGAVSETGRYTRGTGYVTPLDSSPALTRWIRAGSRCAPALCFLWEVGELQVGSHLPGLGGHGELPTAVAVAMPQG